MSRVHSARYDFLLVNESSVLVPDIVLVEFGEAETQARLASAIERHPSLQIVQLVSAKDEIGGHRYQIFGAHLVSDLIPMLERVAGTLADANGGGQMPQMPQMPQNSAQPLVQQAPFAAPRIVPNTSQPPHRLVPQIADTNVVRLPPTIAQRERLRALVVADSPTVRQQLAIIVDRLGLRCDTAESGAEALALLENNAYDIIYVDAEMPDMDGYRLTREIKRNRAHKAIPVIILASKSSPFERARGALAGCDTYLTKPVELKRFFEATRNCLLKNRAVADSHDWITDPTIAPLSAPAAQSSVTGFGDDVALGDAMRPEYTGLRMGGLRHKKT